MKTFVFLFVILCGLFVGSTWLKSHFQNFIKEATNRYMPKKDDQQINLPQEKEEQREAVEDRDNQYNKKKKKKDTEDKNNQTDLSEVNVKFTNEANVQKVKKSETKYEFTYIFRDMKQKGVQFDWTGDKKMYDKLPRLFGLPKDFFKGGYSQSQIDEFQRKGSFRQATMNGKAFTIPDYNKIAADNKPVTLPIYKLLRKYLGNKKSTPTQLIEALMTFCQDIPYKRPPSSRAGKYIGELDVPAKMLTVGTGDCDTKSILFASVLLHQPSIKVAVVLVDNPSHMFAAVRGVPTAYQAFIEYQGEKYIVCEPVGNARLPIGELGFKDCKTRMVVKMITK